jgi:hypothetical protein
LVWAWWQISRSDAPGACGPLSNYFKPRLRLATNVHRAQSVRFTFSPPFIREAFLFDRYLSKSTGHERIKAHRFLCRVTIARLNHIYVPTSYFTRTTPHQISQVYVQRLRHHTKTNKQTNKHGTNLTRIVYNYAFQTYQKFLNFS